MGIIVQKFGGTSVAGIPEIQNVVRKIIATRNTGKDIVAIVSAMAGVTNQLVSYCSHISDLNDSDKLAEYDVALSSGEVVVASLLALALQQQGVKSCSVLSWQLPLTTTNNASKAFISKIDTSLIRNYLSEGIVPVVAGFQGVSTQGRITTLGRGGSDTTAAAIAASLNAESCDIYTDVDGVYTADPRLVPNARKIDMLGYEEMLEFAGLGAKVLHSRSVEIAMRYNIPLQVISTFTEQPGTIITNQDKIMESRKITGIASNKNLAAIYSDSADSITESLAMHDINPDMMYCIEGKVIYFIPLLDATRVGEALKGKKFEVKTDVAVVSAIGFGIKNDIGLFAKITAALSSENIHINMMISSEIKISLMISEPDTERAVKILHVLLC